MFMLHFYFLLAQSWGSIYYWLTAISLCSWVSMSNGVARNVNRGSFLFFFFTLLSLFPFLPCSVIPSSPSPSFSRFPRSPHLLPLRRRTAKIQLGGLGNAVSSSSGIWRLGRSGVVSEWVGFNVPPDTIGPIGHFGDGLSRQNCNETKSLIFYRKFNLYETQNKKNDVQVNLKL